MDLKTLHRAMWSSIAMLIVLAGTSVGIYLLFHQAPHKCSDGVRQVYYRTVTSYDDSYDPPSMDGISHIPVFVCKNGLVVSP